MVRHCWKVLSTWRTDSGRLVGHFHSAAQCDAEAAGCFDAAVDPEGSSQVAAHGGLLKMTVDKTGQEACDRPQVAPSVV